jgi:L-iditol 2-dehydrogenase
VRALVVTEPNVFGLRDVSRPAPGPHEVLCRVRAIAICGTDPHIIQGHYPGFWPQDWPLIPGHEWCGDVVDLGPGAAELGW